MADEGYRVLAGAGQLKPEGWNRPGQVVAAQLRIETRNSAGYPAPAHCDGLVNPGTGIAVRIEARRIERRIDDSELVILVQESLLVRDPGFDVVNTLRVGDVGQSAGIGQRALLRDGFLLNRTEIGKRDWCWGNSCKASRRTKPVTLKTAFGLMSVRPGRRDVEGQDLGALIGRANRMPSGPNDATGSGCRTSSGSGTRSG